MKKRKRKGGKKNKTSQGRLLSEPRDEDFHTIRVNIEKMQDSGIYSGEKGRYLVGFHQICYFELFLCSMGGLLLIKLYIAMGDLLVFIWVLLFFEFPMAFPFF